MTNKILVKRIRKLEGNPLSCSEYLAHLAALCDEGADMEGITPQPSRTHEEWVELLK